MRILLVNAGPEKRGATSRILELLSERLAAANEVVPVCLGALQIGYCRGCKSCHADGSCCQKDDMERVLAELILADAVVLAIPSYWADVPGQCKVFFDRCTPYSNTNPNRARTLPPGKKGYAVVLRTGPHREECEQIARMAAHFYGHMGIEYAGSFLLCGIQDAGDIDQNRDALLAACGQWFPAGKAGCSGKADVHE